MLLSVLLVLTIIGIVVAAAENAGLSAVMFLVVSVIILCHKLMVG